MQSKLTEEKRRENFGNCQLKIINWKSKKTGEISTKEKKIEIKIVKKLNRKWRIKA